MMIREYGFDVETHGTNPWKDDFLFLTAAYWASDTDYHKFSVNHPDAPTNQFFLPSCDTSLLIGHSLTFDRMIVEACYPDLKFNSLGKFFDTQVGQILLDENIPRNSLKALCELYLDNVSKLTNVNVKKLKDIPVNQVLEYNLIDAKVSKLIKEAMWPKLLSKGFGNQFNFLMEVQTLLVEMQILGVNVDQEWTSNAKEEVQEELLEVSYQIFNLMGEEILLSSPKQVAEVLYDKLGYPIISRTKKTKQPQANVDTFKKLKDEVSEDRIELLDLLIKRSKLSKLYSTYLEPFLDKHTGNDGRIHGRYHITRGFEDNRNVGTVTGRLSGSNPNLTNIARDTRIKGCFIPSPGHSFGSVDYSQIELRMAGWLSQDEGMQSIFREEKDLHTSTLALIEGVEYNEACRLIEEDSKWKELRTAIKEFNFANLYGASPFTLQRILYTKLNLKWDIPTIKSYMKKWEIANPQLVKWSRLIKYIIETEREVISEFGMHRRLTHPDKSRRERQGLNFLVQGPAAQLTLASMLLIRENIPEIDIVISVHDSILFEYPEEIDTTSVVDRIHYNMKEEVKNYVVEKFGVKNIDSLYLDVELHMNQERWIH